MSLFRFLWVDWTWGVFLAFLWGVLLGIIVIVGVYVIFVLLSLRKSRYIMKTRVKSIDKSDIEQLIENAKNDYLEKRKEKEPEKGYMTKIIVGLVQDIARIYYPKSKRPMAELTFDELLLLARYITETVDDVLSRPALKVFKRMKLSTVLNILDVRKSKAVKKAQEVNEKYHVKKAYDVGMLIYHSINPFYWFKKAVFDTSMALITKKITLIVIEIVGEQTNKVFSKEALILEDKQLNDMLTSLDTDIEEMKKEEEEAEKEEKSSKDDIKVSKAEKKMMEKIAKADEAEQALNDEQAAKEKMTRAEKRKARQEAEEASKK